MTTIRMTGCMKLINSMSEEDQSALLDRLDAYMNDGVPAKEAQSMAAADTLAELQAERAEMVGLVREQHADLTKAEEPEPAPAEPESLEHTVPPPAAPVNPTPAVPRSKTRADLDADIKAAQTAVFGNADTRDAKTKAKDAGKGFMRWLRERAVQKIVDQFAPIKKLSAKAYLLARMAQGSDGALEAQMLYGKVFVNADGVYDVKLGDGGFAHVMADLKGEHEEFLQWVVALRAGDLRAQRRENLITEDDEKALLRLADGDMPDGRKRLTVYREALDKLTEYNAAVLDMHVASGLIRSDLAELLKPHPYIPFYRELFDDEGHPKYSQSLTGQEAFKKLTGGLTVLHHNLLENVLTNWAHAFSAAAKNRAALATIDAALAVPNLVTQAGLREKGSVRVMRDGRAEYWIINDGALLEAVSAMHYALPEFMKPIAAFKRMLTIGVTSLPGFKVKNLIRDSVQSIALADLDPNLFKNIAAGSKTTDVAGAVRRLGQTLAGKLPDHFTAQNQTFASMLASGGLMRFASGTEGNRSQHVNKMIRRAAGKDVMLDQGSARKLLTYMGDVLEAYHELGDASEQINRVALYERLVAKGHSHAEASFMARDLLDFSMQGSAPVVRFLVATVPFLNARLQGLYRLGRGMAEDPVRAGYTVGAVTLASLALMLMFKDDEDFKRREDWDRDAYWWFKIGNTAFRIPKPFEVGAIGTVAERTWELMFDKEMTVRRYEQRVGQMLGQTFSFNPTPQMFKPILDVYANKDSFTGRAIEGFSMEQLRAEDRYTEETSMTARGLSHVIPHLSPLQIDYMLKGYFGGVAAITTGAIDMVAKPATGQGARPTPQYAKFLTSSLVETDLPNDRSRYVSLLYEHSQQVHELFASYQHALKMGDRGKAMEILAENRGVIGQEKALNEAKARMSKLTAQINRIDASTSLDAANKRSLLDSLRAKRAAIAEGIETRLPAF